MAFNKLTDAEDERLAMLAEEASEVIKCVTKIQRHGWESYNPDAKERRLTNRQHLQKELGELYSVMDKMCELRELDASSIQLTLKSAWANKLHYAHHQLTPADEEAKRRNELWARNISTWSMAELAGELQHYGAKIENAPGWGAAVGEYQKNIAAIRRELDRRDKENAARAAD